MSKLDDFAGEVVLADRVSQTLTKTDYPDVAQSVLSMQHATAAFDEITSWPGYQPTPLHNLDRLASSLNCQSVHYKDESQRFGLGSFKALGGAYAVLWLVAREYHKQFNRPATLSEIRRGDHKAFAATLTITTATDGNHGRSVAWGARNAGCACRIYIHREVSEGRKAAMEAFGAEVIRIDGDYDDSVRQCAAESEKQGWFVVSDTSYEGYRDVPQMVMAGYTVMATEILSQLSRPPTHVFIQAGVGGLAAAVCARLWMHYGQARPRIIVVESEHAACWLDSVRAGQPTAVQIDTETVMAGLSCGEVSELAWQVMSLCTDDVVTLSDSNVAAAMKLFADGEMSGAAIEAGECAVPGVLALMAISQQPALRQSFGLEASSEILVIGCEGATDEQVYRALIESV